MVRRVMAWVMVWLWGVCGVAAAQGDANGAPQWLRYPAISPDGRQIAISFGGDLWVVPTEGGRAIHLTTHEGYERSPVWSPDGRRIAFASDRHGQFDVFVMDATGGAATRLTFHSADDTPSDFTPDGRQVLFASRRLDAPDASVPSTTLAELYAVPVEGGRPMQIMTTPAELARYNAAGTHVVYHDHKGYENAWRKHHRSSIARDVWLFDATTAEHRKLTSFEGEDRNPVFSPDGGSVYYLSEQSGSSNVWRVNLDAPDKPEQVTRHSPHPVRFLSIARDGTLAYGYHGQVWVKPANGEARRVTVQCPADEKSNATQRATLRDGATEMAVSPNEEEVAFVIRGEVFVASLEHGTTKRVTDTPQQERSVQWSPDGRSLYYAGELDHSWNLYRTSLSREDEQRFFEATILTTETVLAGEDETFQPVLSPDGKRIAYLHNRDELRVLDVETKQSKTIVPAERNYSYRDGDITYHWSPDGKWLSFNYHPNRRWLEDVGVADVETGQVTNITESGYEEGGPRFSRDGRALLFYSNRFGRRNHGSWGADGDVMALYLTREADDRTRLSVEEFERLRKKEDKDRKKPKDESEKDDDEDDAEAKEGEEQKPEPPKPVVIEFEGREHRLHRLTLHSAPIADYDLSPDGESLVYLAQVEKKWDLWVSQPRKGQTRKLLSIGDDDAGNATVRFSKDGKKLYLLRGNGKIDVVTLGGSLGENGGKPESKSVGYAAEMIIHSPVERAYMFEHAWRQVLRKFYDPNLHGVDWAAMKAHYLPLLPSVNNNHDFAELLSEMLGELNASHTGSGYRMRAKDADDTAALGVLYDVKHAAAGLRVAEVIARGPADTAGSKIAPGVIITHINGVELIPAANPWALLNHQKDKRVRLALTNPANGESWEQVVKPISQNDERELLYERWIKQRRELTEKLSNGRVGYVHVRSMNDGSFRRTFQDIFGVNSDKEALLVDTRFNGGGWLHDDLVRMLDGEDYIYFVPRGKQRGDLGAEPHIRWTRPVVVVQSESNYSDAHMFPYAFKQLGLGKLVGTPVAGTGTAVWWETLIDPTIYFGIPQVGMVTPEGKYLENQQLDPDVLVYNDPNAMQKGEDPQLAAAVKVLLDQLK